jgi:hypothetical protein
MVGSLWGGGMEYSQTGGARVGRSFWWSVNWTWPFATIEVDPQQLSLRTPGREYRFDRSSIRDIGVIGPAWAPPGFHGISIEHVLQDAPPYVVFWSFERDALIAALRSEGYPVRTSPADLGRY